MKTVYVFGSINCDLLIETPYIPKAGETLTGSGFTIVNGGKGANQAVAAARLGAPVRMGGCVGSDVFGENMRKNLAAFGVDASCVRVADGASGVAVILLSEGNNRIILDKGANGKVENADVDALLSTAKAGDIFVTQAENPVPVLKYALKTAKEKGLITVFNPAPATKELAELFPFADYITPNETETAILSDGKPLDKACASFGVPTVIVTLGGDGWLCYQEGKTFTGKAYPVDVVDTTAAGDTFLGGFVSRLARGENLSDALSFGAVAASLACTKKGAQPSIPTLSEVEKVFKK